MDFHQLFNLKEKLLAELNDEISKKDFPTEKAKNEYYCIKLEAIIEFYAQAMITILDSEASKSRAA